MHIDEVIARESIRDAESRWTDAVNRRDYDTFRGLWAEDAVWTIGAPFPMQVSGAVAIVAKLLELLTYDTAFFQSLHEGVIDVAPDRKTARARYGVTEYGRPGDGVERGYYNHAQYHDQLVATPEGWKFKRRDYLYVYVDSTPLRGQWFSMAQDPG